MILLMIYVWGLVCTLVAGSIVKDSKKLSISNIVMVSAFWFIVIPAVIIVRIMDYEIEQ